MGIKPPSPGRRSLLQFGAALAAAATLPPFAAAQDKPVLKIASYALEPFCMLDEHGQPYGLSIDLLRLLEQESGITMVNMVMPYPRAMAMIASGKMDLVFSFSNSQLRSHAREIGPISYGDVVVMARAGTQFASTAELHGKTMGYIRGAEYDLALQSDPAIGHYETISYEQTVRMLLKGRFDAALGVRLSLLNTLHRMGLTRDTLGPELPVTRRDMIVHYSAKTYDAHIAAELQRGLASLRARGALASVLKSYEQALR